MMTRLFWVALIALAVVALVNAVTSGILTWELVRDDIIQWTR